MGNNYWESNNDYWKQKLNKATTIVDDAVGLRQFMTQTFTWMTLGLALTGLMAVFTVSSQAMLQFVFGTPFVFLGLIIAEFAMVVGFGVSLSRGGSVAKLLFMFLAYSLLNGVTLSAVLLAYTHASVGQAFFIAAGMFGGMALYGYVTKKDLTGIGQFAAMGVWGLILLLIVNMFVQSSTINLATGLIGVGIFVVLTAYDTQKLKTYYYQSFSDGQALQRMAIGGALMLYLDFINLFLSLLRIFGRRR